ncbi:MAG: acyltransferase [Bacteroidetes bacterium]|nr:acyltransferase [Bacteroidota bacterium]
MKKERIFGLDIMRCVAILTVLIGHLYYVVGIPISISTVGKIDFDGVNIFFTLSGFLIGKIIFEKLSQKNIGIHSLISFWKARWWRTLPGYFFVLLILLPEAIFNNHINGRQVIQYLLFLQNFHSGQIPTFGESWSLTIEEWFYLTSPIFLFCIAKFFNLKKGAPFVIFFYLIAGFAIRAYKIHQLNFNTYLDYVYYIRQALPARIDAVMFGVTGAYLSFYRFKVWTDYRLIFFHIGVIGFLAHHELIFWNGLPEMNNYFLYFSSNIELFFCLCTIPFLSNIRVGKGYIAKAVSFIALISYSIYLIQGSVFSVYIKKWLPSNPYFKSLIYFLFAFVFGYLLYITVEKWGMRQRDKFNLKNRPGTLPEIHSNAVSVSLND